MDDQTTTAAARAEALLRHLPDCVCVVDGDGFVRFCGGEAGGGFLGYPPGSFSGRRIFDVVHPDDLVATLDAFAALRDRHDEPRPGIRLEARLRANDGSYQDVELTMRDLRDDPVVGGIALYLRDVTSRVMLNETLVLARTTSALLEHAADVTALVDRGGRLTYISPACETALGYRPEELLARDRLPGQGTVISLVHPDDVESTVDAWQELVGRAGETLTLACRICHRDGSTRYFEVTLTNLLHDTSVQGVALNARDLTVRYELERDLSHQALHDPLTGLPNRALLVDRLEQAVARLRRGDGRLMVLFCDLDGFKEINDSLGHEAGDLVLAEIGRRLLEAVRPGDTVARLGGDEFVVVCPDVRDAFEELPRRILEAVSHPVELPGCQVIITASIGVALAGSGGLDAARLLRDADTAMYRAKRAGRARAVRTVIDEPTGKTDEVRL